MAHPSAREAPLDLSVEFLPLTPFESAVAWPLDRPRVTAAPTPDGPPPPSARAALELILGEALQAPTCFVLFSGGRDSSALLAVATHVARAHGRPDPVPVTARHPGDSSAGEDDWQELVVSHLGLRDWLRLDFRGDQRLLAPTAQSGLRRHGLVWPEAVQVHGAIYAHLDAGSSVVSGEGGDQTITSRRSTIVTWALRRPRRAYGSREAITSMFAPGPLGLLLARREIRRRPMLEWLRPDARERVVASQAREERESLRWDVATRGAVASRLERLIAANFATAIREYRLHPVSPFYDQRFVEALAREGGLRGLGNRTEMMTHLFSDVLPIEVVRRSTKATFSDTRWGEGEREFARSWTGVGVDHDLVDVEQLRADWLSELPSFGSDYLLHRAWLATHSPAESARTPTAEVT